MNPDGAFLYTPADDFNGVDSFTFLADDGQVASAPARVTITVNPVNDAPSAEDKASTGYEDQPIVSTVTGHDVDGDPWQLTNVAGTPEQAERLDTLRGLLDAWMRETGDTRTVFGEPTLIEARAGAETP